MARFIINHNIFSMLPINGIKETAIKKSQFFFVSAHFVFILYLPYIQFVLVISTAAWVAAALQINCATYKSNHTSFTVALTINQYELA